MDDRIIVIDDDPDYADVLRRYLHTEGYGNLHIAYEPLKAAELFDQGESFDLAFIDLNMPEMDGATLLDVIKSNSPNTACIIVTAVNDLKVAVECIRKGAYEYLLKPVSRENLVLAAKRALERKHLLDILDIDKQKALPKLANKDHFRPIVTRSRNVLKVLKEAELHAHSDVPVLITGESGTGKELLARAIHRASPRSTAPMTPVNMAALTPGLFDAEFFGHTRGAFTGAERERTGYLEHTNNGTVFLDEIGTMPLELQGKLLRVLQNGEYMKIGTNTPKKANVRFIAATNEDMDQLIEQKQFRKDLYYRLRGGWLHLPPLRERKADIPLLINLFLKEFSGPNRKCRGNLQALSLLMGYDYPGNIRELRSIIQSAVNLCNGNSISPGCLPAHLRKAARQSAPEPSSPAPYRILKLAYVEKQHIVNVYRQTGRNKSATARDLGIGLNTLRRKLAAYGEK
ncbi:MAG: sigma-54-dependent Fis family transcriptional regulator [Deltaproteobacteria bacterium]|nr:sigma-54-dependent Fis family transcriptional regulator [Deltaproteobacteria bacterium]